MTGDVRFITVIWLLVYIARFTITKKGTTIARIARQRLLQAVLVIAFVGGATSVKSEESLFLPAQNAYNPVPSPDGSKVAFVETGRGGGSGGLGRSNLLSRVNIADKHGKLLRDKPLADAFLAGWTHDGAALVCYRDWRYSIVSLDGTTSEAGEVLEPMADQHYSRTERVLYPGPNRRFFWFENDSGHADGTGVVRTSDGNILARYKNALSDTFAALSNDGKWLAVVAYSKHRDRDLVVLNLATKQWYNLGPVVVHPFSHWDYIKSSWNPWFKDSSHLAFVSQGSVVVATPDGKQQKSLCQLQEPAGLAVPSPNGTQVAYVTFAKLPDKRFPMPSGPPIERHPNPNFWGDARVWVVSVEQPGNPKPVTREDPDTIYTLRWLNDEEVIFDRLKDRPLTSHYSHARLWRADVPRDGSKNLTK